MGNHYQLKTDLEQLAEAYENFLKGFAVLDELWSDARHRLSDYVKIDDIEKDFQEYVAKKRKNEEKDAFISSTENVQETQNPENRKTDEAENQNRMQEDDHRKKRNIYGH